MSKSISKKVTTASKSTSKKLSGVQKGAIALAATAAAVAGALFVYGRQDTKTKNKIRSWGLKAKAEVMERLAQAKEMNKETFDAIVEKVGEKYENLKNVDKDEVRAMVRDMKKHWAAIRKSMEK